MGVDLVSLAAACTVLAVCVPLLMVTLLSRA